MGLQLGYISTVTSIMNQLGDNYSYNWVPKCHEPPSKLMETGGRGAFRGILDAKPD